jgi:hypothetical protein
MLNATTAKELNHMTAYAELHPIDLVDAIAETSACRYPDDSGPDWRTATARRIVEVTDQDETLIPAFIPFNR